MPSERLVRKLSDVAAFQEGYVNPSQSRNEYFDGEVKWLRAVDLNNGRVRSTSRTLTKEGFLSAGKSAVLFQPGTLAISKSGTIGRLGILDDFMCGNRAVINIRPTDEVDTRFLFYSLLTLQHQILVLAEGSVQKNLYVSAIGKLEVQLPPLDEQRSVAAVLGALDDRIDLLRQANTTLEAIAQALFKSWFVDFDPVRAKAEGREPEGMDAATAALFPSEFEESELGLIPKGWRHQSLYDTAQFINGAAYKAFSPNIDRRGLPIVKIAELKSGITNQTAYSDVQMDSKYRIDSGDILFSWSGNPDTSIDTFVWGRGPALLNQHIFRVVPELATERSRVLTMLKYLRPQFAEVARNKQTTGLGHVTVGNLKEMRVVRPPEDISLAWSRLVDPVVERAFETQRQSLLLEDIRDSLLPRLISGKLRIPEAEALIDEVSA